jgi:pSer/pThr/pTyr-binding forkhead associated (FHA) protein
MDELIIARANGVLVRRIDLTGRRKLTIGRSHRCELRLDHPSVSRRHALLFAHDGRWLIVDSGSALGLHGRRGRTRMLPLDDGDWCRIGPACCWLHRRAAASASRSIFDESCTPGAGHRAVSACDVVDPEVARSPMILHIIEPGRSRHLRVRFESADLVTIGRSRACDVVVDDPAMSCLQAAVYLEGERWCVADAGTGRGITIGGRRYLRKRLDGGDVVRVGRSHLWVAAPAVIGLSAGAGGAGGAGEVRHRAA